MNALEKLHNRISTTNSLLCVGLDSDIAKLPRTILSRQYPQYEFNRAIIDDTHEYVCAYKPNFAFYEARGEKGMKELKMTMEYLKNYHPDIFTIADAKRADIGNTNTGYVEEIFDWLGFDAVTLHPYLGREALLPFLEREDKVSIILCRTSNPGAPEFQDLESGGKPLWQSVAEHVSTQWNTASNCMLVVGATYPPELARVREIVGDMTLLIPGIGAQGGDIQATVQAGKDANGAGMIINNGRAIVFAADPGTEAKNCREEINRWR